LQKILKDIKINFGKVYFIFANLKALEINKRFYEKNLNRCFYKNNN
jgi:succinylglutamate desuccinylase